MPSHGCEPCVCLPFTLIENQSLEAMSRPDLYLILPISVCALIWMPNMASIFGLSITPSLTISRRRLPRRRARLLRPAER